MGCGGSKALPPEPALQRRPSSPRALGAAGELNAGPDSPERLAKQTYFSVPEVEALGELYDKLISNSEYQDGVMHKEEFMLALFKSRKNSLFGERVFDLFDIKRNNVIEFGEFVRSLSVFHPKAPLQEKAQFAFRLYDIGHTGAIERSELKRFLIALMVDNPDIDLDEQALDEIVDETFAEMDLSKDGRINPEEWMVLVQRNPGIISYMTLPVLTELCQRFPLGTDRGGRRNSHDGGPGRSLSQQGR